MRKKLPARLWAGVLCGILLVCAAAMDGYAVKWFFRWDCLCFRAHFHAGQRYAIDRQIVQASGYSGSEEQWILCTVECRHNERLMALIYADSYTICER